MLQWTIAMLSINTSQNKELLSSSGSRKETRQSSAFSKNEPLKQPLKIEQPSEIQVDETRLSDLRFRKLNNRLQSIYQILINLHETSYIFTDKSKLEDVMALIKGRKESDNQLERQLNQGREKTKNKVTRTKNPGAKPVKTVLQEPLYPRVKSWRR